RAPRRARDSGSRWGWRRGARDRRRTCRRRSSARRPKWPLPCSCWQYSDAVMNESVSIPVWLAIPAALLAAWAAYDKLVVPALRWMVTRPANQVIDELSTRLRIGIRPFQRTRRQALIHRLTTDPKVLQTAEKFSRDKGVPVPSVLRQVDRYARELVPAFNAYL